jgi:hypothetical protein
MWRTQPGDNAEGLVRNGEESKEKGRKTKMVKAVLSFNSILLRCLTPLFFSAVTFQISVNLVSLFDKRDIVKFVFLT